MSVVSCPFWAVWIGIFAYLLEDTRVKLYSKWNDRWVLYRIHFEQCGLTYLSACIVEGYSSQYVQQVEWRVSIIFCPFEQCGLTCLSACFVEGYRVILFSKWDDRWVLYCIFEQCGLTYLSACICRRILVSVQDHIVYQVEWQVSVVFVHFEQCELTYYLLSRSSMALKRYLWGIPWWLSYFKCKPLSHSSYVLTIKYEYCSSVNH